MNKEIHTITDWKGNVVKEGDEICLVKIKTGGFFKNLMFLIPKQDGTFSTISIPDENEVDCWEVGEYFKVEPGFKYTIIRDTYSLTDSISMLLFFTDKKHVLAIKGVSDTKN